MILSMIWFVIWFFAIFLGIMTFALIRNKGSGESKEVISLVIIICSVLWASIAVFH